MKIIVKEPLGTEIMTLEVESSDTVFSVKEKIPDTEVFPRIAQQIFEAVRSTKESIETGKILYFRDQELEHFRVLADYKIGDNDTLHLFGPEVSEVFTMRMKIMSTVMYVNYKKPEFITVSVGLPNGKSIALEEERTTKMLELIRSIPQIELMPIVQQIMKPVIPKIKTHAKVKLNLQTELSHQGQKLSWHDTLENYNIKNGDELRLKIDLSWEIQSAKVNYPADDIVNLPKPASTIYESAKVNDPTDHITTANLPILATSTAPNLPKSTTSSAANLPEPATSITSKSAKVNDPIDHGATANLPMLSTSTAPNIQKPTTSTPVNVLEPATSITSERSSNCECAIL